MNFENFARTWTYINLIHDVINNGSLKQNRTKMQAGESSALFFHYLSPFFLSSPAPRLWILWTSIKIRKITFPSFTLAPYRRKICTTSTFPQWIEIFNGVWRENYQNKGVISANCLDTYILKIKEGKFGRWIQGEIICNPCFNSYPLDNLKPAGILRKESEFVRRGRECQTFFFERIIPDWKFKAVI